LSSGNNRESVWQFHATNELLVSRHSEGAWVAAATRILVPLWLASSRLALKTEVTDLSYRRIQPRSFGLQDLSQDDPWGA
jgi:hypothetical protein